MVHKEVTGSVERDEENEEEENENDTFLFASFVSLSLLACWRVSPSSACAIPLMRTTQPVQLDEQGSWRTT